MLVGISPLMSPRLQAVLYRMGQGDEVVLADAHFPGESCSDRYWPDTPPFERVERFAFYEQARGAFAVVMSGESARFGNILHKKGATPAG